MSDTPKPSVIEPGAERLVPTPPSGRVFTTSRRVSIDDAAPSGRMETDAIARFLQDAGNDDTDDAGLAELGLAWVARRATIEVTAPARARESLAIHTWCSGTGRRWAERRTSLRGEHGAHLEAGAIWVHLDPDSGRPSPWGDDFASAYLEATSGRTVDAKLRHDKAVPESATRHPWRFRQSDMDGFGHVNNAAYLAVVEEHLSEEVLGQPHRVEIEWRAPSHASDELVVAVDDGRLWLLDAEDQLRVTVVVTGAGVTG